ncbi:AAA family ATPase [Synechococcus sp. CBW1002]|uniref:ATP-dependent DNA helicase n=1 Tax=unclassified Synechococcus TaxID=2626047 RepID=UPI0018CDFA6D|nr:MULTISPECIES: AAA family ATPase [unclassified Synechococcus]QPN58818.1 AAA family ATPase [Synechococcus sp. CBW1002]QPN65557.1 AAA family ATPase [Synechococcus sp. CBW1006]
MTSAAAGLGLAELLLEALPRLYATQINAGKCTATPLDPALLEVMAALGSALERGELDLDLEGPAPAEVEASHWPQRHRQALAHSPLSTEAIQLNEAPEAPLVLVDGRLVRWRRWHQQLEGVMESLIQRARSPLPAIADSSPQRLALDRAAAAGLDRTQQRAVAAALHHGLVLLGGGPGTGKTSTVVQILAAQLSLQPALRIQLAAPTGKAAARLLQAIEDGAGCLAPAVAGKLRRTPCGTLHRLLESNGERFGRHRHRPLQLDLLVVDEVSMVDLPLMEALLDALPATCRLVLVGDPAQLPPVGPGPVLLELQRPARLKALGEAAVQLTTTYRNHGAIAELANWLRGREGHDPQGSNLHGLASQLEACRSSGNLAWQQANPVRGLPAALLEPLRRRQLQLASLAAAMASSSQPTDGASALLEALGEMLILTPVRRGRWGVEAIHQALLGDAATAGPGAWPPGTPVLCCRNLPDLGLANGDLGVVVHRRGGARRLLFAAASGGPDRAAASNQDHLRWLHPAQMAGAVEPALALTVHKAQGSEADTVIVLLPDPERDDPRLLYTALTRARHQALLITAPLT